MVFSLRGLKKSHSLFVLVAINSTTIQSVLTLFSVSDEVTGTYHCTGVNGNGSLTAVASLQLFGELHTHSLSLSLSGKNCSWERKVFLLERCQSFRGSLLSLHIQEHQVPLWM